MGFGDIFKNSFMEGFYSTDISLATILLSMAIVCLIALYIFFAYRLLTRRTFYNKNFGISLAALAIITAAIILTIQSSIVISLGMVGALSIVRFRTAIKEPMDLVDQRGDHLRRGFVFPGYHRLPDRHRGAAGAGSDSGDEGPYAAHCRYDRSGWGRCSFKRGEEVQQTLSREIPEHLFRPHGYDCGSQGPGGGGAGPGSLRFEGNGQRLPALSRRGNHLLMGGKPCTS